LSDSVPLPKWEPTDGTPSGGGGATLAAVVGAAVGAFAIVLAAVAVWAYRRRSAFEESGDLCSDVVQGDSNELEGEGEEVVAMSCANPLNSVNIFDQDVAVDD
jgi:hypothetical protein